ncbi:hypothetical protein Taro_041395 [Colocasia esculenta]|uniref:Uncharacterized protein n=1 Tax=Colocasia esculenta TaxID=4460 RepID=A0A843WFR0_COLES|nr:hypothetical protein [Colocasia esculenta]
MGLVSWKDIVIEQSIHSGYVEAIRRYNFFENCASWKEDQDSECLNLLPIKIAANIVRKI